MSGLNFKNFFYCITESIEEEITKLQQQISTIEAQKFSRTKPLDDALGRLRTMLAQKQRQATTQNANNSQSTKPTTQTTTPGSGGKETPGV